MGSIGKIISDRKKTAKKDKNLKERIAKNKEASKKIAKEVVKKAKKI